MLNYGITEEAVPHPGAGLYGITKGACARPAVACLRADCVCVCVRVRVRVSPKGSASSWRE